jgi:hypothetical protein
MAVLVGPALKYPISAGFRLARFTLGDEQLVHLHVTGGATSSRLDPFDFRADCLDDDRRFLVLETNGDNAGILSTAPVAVLPGAGLRALSAMISIVHWLMRFAKSLGKSNVMVTFAVLHFDPFVASIAFQEMLGLSSSLSRG